MDGIYRMEDPDRKPANDLNNFELIDVQRLSVSSCKTETPTANNEHSYSYEDVLDMIGFGKTQIIVLLVSGLLLMAVINETMGMSIITIASQCDFSTTSMEKGLMGGAAFIGILCSSYFWGYLCDVIGRKPVLIYSTLSANVLSFLSIFMPNFWVFLLLRFAVGLFIAGASSTTYAYLGEMCIAKHRAVLINYATMFVGVSMAYVPAVAWLVLSMEWSFSIWESFEFRPWRLLTLFNLLPGFIAVLILFFLPDTPKILLSVQKREQAFEAVNWICKFNTGRTLEDLKVHKLNDEVLVQNERILQTSKSITQIFKQMWQDTRPLFQKPHVINFIIGCTLMSGLFLSNSGMGLWYPEIQNRLGSIAEGKPMTICQVIDSFSNQTNGLDGEKVCDDTITTKSFIDSLTFGLSFTVGYILLGLVINPLGRKRAMILALVISAINGFLLHWLLDPIAIVVCFILFLMLPGICVSILNSAMVDLVPTNLRGKAVCICLMVGRSGSVIGSNIIASLLETNCIVTFALFYVLVLLCAILAYMLPI